MPINTIIDYKFRTFGYKTYIQEKRGSFKITINKTVAIGAGLRKGGIIYSYVGEDPDGREVLITYLDGRERKTEFNKIEFENNRKINKTEVRK